MSIRALLCAAVCQVKRKLHFESFQVNVYGCVHNSRVCAYAVRCKRGFPKRKKNKVLLRCDRHLHMHIQASTERFNVARIAHARTGLCIVCVWSVQSHLGIVC